MGFQREGRSSPVGKLHPNAFHEIPHLLANRADFHPRAKGRHRAIKSCKDFADVAEDLASGDDVVIEYAEAFLEFGYASSGISIFESSLPM